MLPISERAASLGTENAFVVLKDVLARAAAGADIKNFCIGQPDFVTPDAIRLAAVRALIEGKTGYTPSAGIPELREAIAASVPHARPGGGRGRRGGGVRRQAVHRVRHPDRDRSRCGPRGDLPGTGLPHLPIADPGAGRGAGAAALRERNGFRPDPEELRLQARPAHAARDPQLASQPHRMR